MDFRFRANEEKTFSSYFSSSSNDGYFTQQALRAGYISNDIGRVEFGRSSDPVREAIQRELEKERIREEIIASEIVRKQALEAEVRRELAMERDLAFRRAEGFSFVSTMPAPQSSMFSDSRAIHHAEGSNNSENRLSFPVAPPEIGGLERLPFQLNREPSRVVAAEGKVVPQVSKGGQVGKVMLLAKPVSPNLAGTKRKSASLVASDTSIVGLKKKPHKEWSCALCKVSATSEQGLHDHLQGKKHKSKEAELRTNRTASKNTGGSTPLPKKIDKPSKEAKNSCTPKQKQGNKEDGKPVQAKKSLQKKQMTEELKKRKFKLWCEPCRVGCQSETVMAEHRRGKKHLAWLRGLKQNGGVLTATSTMNTVKASLEKADNATEEVKKETMGNAGGEVDGVEVAEEEEKAETIEAPLDNVAEVGAEELEGL